MVKFSNERLRLVLNAVIKIKRLSDGGAADEIGISRATMSRIMAGKSPDVDTLVKIMHWGNFDFKDFIEEPRP